MATDYPQFTEHPDKAIRFVEYQALLRLVYSGDTRALLEAHPEVEGRWPYWQDYYHSKPHKKHKELMSELMAGVYPTIDNFYVGIKKLLKPAIKGKALRDKKKRTAQKEYQKEKLGEAYIDNDELISQARKVALELADTGADEEAINIKVKVLAEMYTWDAPLSDIQLENLTDFVKAKIEKHLKLDRIEAKILDARDKNLYYMYGQIKRKINVGDMIELGLVSAAKLGGCSRTYVKPVLSKLERLGFITCTQKGKQGSQTYRSSIYRREA
jgi:hypothetical protein